MTDDEKEALIANSTQETARHLARIDGMQPALVLAVMHAEIMSLIATTYGGVTAAECARRAAERIEGYPSFADAPLAAMRPAGRA